MTVIDKIKMGNYELKDPYPEAGSSVGTIELSGGSYTSLEVKRLLEEAGKREEKNLFDRRREWRQKKEDLFQSFLKDLTVELGGYTEAWEDPSFRKAASMARDRASGEGLIRVYEEAEELFALIEMARKFDTDAITGL